MIRFLCVGKKKVKVDLQFYELVLLSVSITVAYLPLQEENFTRLPHRQYVLPLKSEFVSARKLPFHPLAQH